MLNLEAVSDGQKAEPMEVGQVLDLDIIRPKFEDYKREAARIAADARELCVKDEASLSLAVMIGGNAKRIVKAIDAKRKDIILAPQEFVRGVNAICKIITDSLDEAELTAKSKISQHRTRIELERRKQEEAARRAAAEVQTKLDAEAKAAGVEAPKVVAPVIPAAPKVVRTENGSSHQVKRWVCTVVDAAAVPREYCEPSKRLLDDAVKMGVRSVAGCVIEEISETRFRT